MRMLPASQAPRSRVLPDLALSTLHLLVTSAADFVFLDFLANQALP